MNKKEYDQSPNKCKSCNSEIPYKKRRNIFCTRSCAATYNNKGVRRHGAGPANTHCINCREKISETRNGRKYCSLECRSKFKFNKYINNWKSGLVTGNIGMHGCISKHIRRYLFEKYDNKCSKCGWSKINKYTGKIPLQVDHIDGNSENNKEDNLRLLCGSCHSLTPTYGSLNRGNGRRNRYK